MNWVLRENNNHYADNPKFRTVHVNCFIQQTRENGMSGIIALLVTLHFYVLLLLLSTTGTRRNFFLEREEQTFQTNCRTAFFSIGGWRYNYNDLISCCGRTQEQRWASNLQKIWSILLFAIISTAKVVLERHPNVLEKNVCGQCISPAMFT